MNFQNSEWFDPTATGLARAATSNGWTVAKLAKVMGVSRQVCYAWLQRGFVPAGRAAEIERITGVPARELIDPKLRKLTGT